MKKVLFVLFTLLISTGNAQTTEAASSHDADIDSMFAANAAADSILKANNARNAYIDIVVQDVAAEVNDWEDVLSKDEETSLIKLIRAFEKKTTNETAIITVADIGPFGTDLDDFSLRLSNKLGVGKKINNNGITIVVSQKLRKVRISTGLGMATALPDAECKRIIDDIMIPELKNGNYNAGITNGLNAIIKFLNN